MNIIKVPVNYYQQYDADYSLDVPAESFGGWKKDKLELDLDRTAVVVMHAMYYGEQKDIEGMFRALEFIPRAYDIGEKVMPGLIKAIRSAGIKVFHVAGSEEIALRYPGYEKTVRLAGNVRKLEQVEHDPVYERLQKFRLDRSYPGAENIGDYNKGCKAADFDMNIMPLDDEEIILDEGQLLALCRKYGINHLIYIGFNINYCILFSGGGMTHMSRHGVICSTIRQAVTAVENKESARDGLALELSMWLTAVGFGFVYDLEDFISSLDPGRME